jgi:glycosyltransferase involved in cell wall biosynthesis
MRVALYVPSWPPGGVANGIVTYASQLVPALRRLGHEVFVLTPRKAQRHYDPYTIDLQDFSVPRNLWDRAMFRIVPEKAEFKAASSAIASAVKELFDKYALDIFEMEESYGWSFAVSELKLLPVVVRLHGPWFLNGQFNDHNDRNHLSLHRQEWEGRGISDAQFVSSPSAEVLRAVKDRYRLNLTASQTIANPLDAVSKERAWDISTCDANSLLFVGRFDKRKGGDLALRVFADLMAAYPALRLTFIGPDLGLKQGDGSIKYFEQYSRDCFSQVTISRIRFLSQLDRADVMSLRPKHFVTIIASQYEICPYSVLEAMSFGCPVVATDVGGIPELIKDNCNGLLVSSQNPEAMTAACRKLLDDPTLAARLGRQAWQDCAKYYATENIAEQTVAAYRKVIETFGR